MKRAAALAWVIAWTAGGAVCGGILGALLGYVLTWNAAPVHRRPDDPGDAAGMILVALVLIGVLVGAACGMILTVTITATGAWRRWRRAAPASALRARQIAALSALAVIALGLSAVAARGAIERRARRAEARRLLLAGSEVVRLRPSLPTCAPGEPCRCRIAPSEVFESCRVIDERRILSIPSLDRCFSQWVVVDTVWAAIPSPMYVGGLWVSRKPEVVAPGWSRLAVAPCLD